MSLIVSKQSFYAWTPSHVSIHGNETADSAAKSALTFPITNVKLPARELIPHISKFCLDEWQDVWDWSTRHAVLVTFIFTSTGHILGPYGNTTMKSDDITTLCSSVVLYFVPVLPWPLTFWASWSWPQHGTESYACYEQPVYQTINLCTKC